MHAAIDHETLRTRIAHLERELLVAQQRATVAEEQLRRVHEAVRAFKQKQLQARAAAVAAKQAAVDTQVEAVQPSASGISRTWAAGDPSLDERLDHYLQSEFEPDRSRDWMLNE